MEQLGAIPAYVFIQQVLPYFNLLHLPNMGQIFTLIMLWGVNHAIIKYQFLSVSSTAITNELFNELTGLTLLTDAEGYIIKANRQVYLFLDCAQNEIVGCHITELLRHSEITRVFSGCTAMKDRVRLQDITLEVKSGTFIPFNITIIPLHSKTDLIGGFLVIGEDIRPTKCLEDEIVNHKLTNERLRNSEQLFRTLLEVAPVSIFIISQHTDCIKYLNTRAVSLLEEDRCQLIGTNIAKYFADQQDVYFLTQSLLESQGITKKEILFRKTDGTQFVGLVTVITSIYNEEAVTLACVVDMTEQKKTEEALKHNNESIHKLNQELLKMNHLLTNKSIKDSLTNLYNHQYINEVLAAKLKKVALTKESLCVMMMDIDHFKWVNDGFGHQVGDAVLISVAELIQKNTREDDYIGRYGGEEFIVVLPDTNMSTAYAIAENIRVELQNYDFEAEGLQVTISIGVANHQGEGLDALVHKADMLLYQAKSNGRNRIETVLEETSHLHPQKA